QDVAVVAGVLVVADHEAIADVLDPVYAALDVEFDPGTVGSTASAGGEGDPDVVARAVADALVGERESTVERVQR
ncbi:MAG: lipoate--protein ligase family protein, partial [Halobacteria archaeon]|nr:lipoate--protein ligase family protein [Halobacteria archaeon]